jgi:hypothetical protein
MSNLSWLSSTHAATILRFIGKDLPSSQQSRDVKASSVIVRSRLHLISCSEFDEFGACGDMQHFQPVNATRSRSMLLKESLATVHAHGGQRKCYIPNIKLANKVHTRRKPRPGNDHKDHCL